MRRCDRWFSYSGQVPHDFSQAVQRAACFFDIVSSMAKLSEILKERGYVHQFSSETLEEITDGDTRTVYLGVDPSADSIHLGNFVQYMFLRRFAEAGHKIILIIGGAPRSRGIRSPTWSGR